MSVTDRSWKWIDAHYCSLPSQTNVYGLMRIKNENGANRLLVTSLKGDVHVTLVSFDYQKMNKLKPSTRAIQFTYIPGDAEIVSIDVMTRDTSESGLVVGITFIRHQEHNNKPTGQFLNLYFSFQGNEEEAEEDIMTKTIELSYVPYKLTHTVLVKGGDQESVFLLCGGDNKIHLYRDTADNNFLEESTEEYFPEFQDCKSSVLQLILKYTDKYEQRITAMGFQNGCVKLTLVDVEKCAIIQSWCDDHKSPITSLVLFNPQNQVHCPSFIESSQGECGIEEEQNITYSLLVTSALMPATVYRNVLNNALEDYLTVPNSEKYDSPLCSCVVDIDFDGQNELLIGTYGQELLAYKYVKHDGIDTSENKEAIKNEKHDIASSEQNKEHLETFPDELSKNSLVKSKISCVTEGYELLWTRSFAYPVVGLDSLDIMGDGMEDLTVVTLKGLHILQPDLSEVAKVCLERLRVLADTESECEDAYLELQNESLEGEMGDISN